MIINLIPLINLLNTPHNVLSVLVYIYMSKDEILKTYYIWMYSLLCILIDSSFPKSSTVKHPYSEQTLNELTLIVK